MSEIRKQMQAKKKEEILKQFQMKRQGFTARAQTISGGESSRSTPALSRQSSSMAQTEDDEEMLLPEAAECSLCKESLSLG